jgi:hypothetical protein
MASATQFRCLELIPLRWATDQGEYTEYAVLHEISAATGLFQVDEPAPVGTRIVLMLPHAEVPATVQSCTAENSGFMLDVAVEQAQDWLGGRFRPTALIPLRKEPRLQLPLAS